MSLTPIGMTFVIVAILFIACGAVSVRLTSGVWGVGGRVSPPPPRPKSWGAIVGDVWLGATVEALLLVLLAALWFGSLGHGGWLLVFLLLGAIVAGPEGWTRHRLLDTPATLEVRLLLLTLLRYVSAGLIGSWLIS